jgi:hypothetical protein
MSAAAGFDKHVRTIVDGFLHTVVIVDDRAFPPEVTVSDESEFSKTDTEGSSDGGEASSVFKLDLQVPPDEEVNGHGLNPREVINAFAKTGLICTILDPGEPIESRLRDTVGRADLLVMDWWIRGQRGGRAIELIEEVLRADEKDGSHRLRLIAIYTGENDLNGVADELATMLEGFFKECEFHRELDSLSMKKGPVKITVLAKADADIPNPPHPNQVDVAELPNRLAAEFTDHARGLVTAVALEALSALRRDTHRILDKLGPDLDHGYLGHRVSLVTPTDAEAHLTGMVASEIRSVLADGEIGTKANFEAIQLWLSRVTAEGYELGALFTFDTKVSVKQIENMLRLGLGDEDTFPRHKSGLRKRNDKQLREIRKQATRLFCASESDSTEGDAAFSSRMMFQTSYRNPRRELRLGTVVYRRKQFYVCVQPVCDSVRLPKEADVAFPFLPLEAPNKGKTDLVVPHPVSGEWVPLSLVRKPRTIEMIEFRPNGDRVVPAYKEGATYRFKSTQGGYRWVADLKPEFAQRVANELGDQFSRLGVDEPEILRLSRK